LESFKSVTATVTLRHCYVKCLQANIFAPGVRPPLPHLLLILKSVVPLLACQSDNVFLISYEAYRLECIEELLR